MLRRFIAMVTTLFIAVFPLIPTAAASNASPLPLRGKVIILDAGHGYGNTNTYAGYDEQLAMFKLSQKIKPLLEDLGATVHMTRPTQADVNLYERAALINGWALADIKEKLPAASADRQEIDRLLGILRGVIENSGKNASVCFNAPYSSKRKISADLKKIFEYENNADIYSRFLVISLHSNATPTPINTSANGADIYITSGSSDYFNYTNSQRDAYFGGLLLGNISKLGIARNKINYCNLLLVREHNLPGVLAENGFHTNKSDRDKLLSDAFLDKLAKAYADSISDYFKTYPNLR